MTNFAYMSLLLVLIALSVTEAASIQKPEENFNLEGTGCVCEGFSCGCCVNVECPVIGLDDTACVNVTYLPNEYGIHFTLNIDELYIFNETISVRNPPPICAGAPILEDFAELCIHFHDLDATSTKLHGCVDLEGRLRNIVVFRYELGCFNLGKSSDNVQHWKKIQLAILNKIRAIKLGRQPVFNSI